MELKLSELKRITNAEKFFSAALIDLSFLEKSLKIDNTFRGEFTVDIPLIEKDECLTESILSPDHIHFILFLHSFIEKTLKYISLMINETVTNKKIFASKHNLRKLFKYSNLNEEKLKKLLEERDYEICSYVLNLKYSDVRYFSSLQSFIFDRDSLQNIVNIFKKELIDCRSKYLYDVKYRVKFVRKWRDRFSLFCVNIPVSKEAPKVVNATVFINITNHRSHIHLIEFGNNGIEYAPNKNALTDQECEFLTNVYEFKNSAYYLKENVDKQTSKKIFRLFAKANYRLPKPEKKISVGKQRLPE